VMESMSPMSTSAGNACACSHSMAPSQTHSWWVFSMSASNAGAHGVPLATMHHVLFMLGSALGLLGMFCDIVVGTIRSN
jgi:hypothetical protein